MNDANPVVNTLGLPFLDHPDAWSGLNLFLQHTGYGGVRCLVDGSSSGWECRLPLSDGRVVVARGHSRSAMARELLTEVHTLAPELFEDWEDVRKVARGGDILIKLLWHHVADERGGVSGLNRIESNTNLASIFDAVVATGEVGPWGGHLSCVRKATVVEAWVARRMLSGLSDTLKDSGAVLTQLGLFDAA